MTKAAALTLAALLSTTALAQDRAPAPPATVPAATAHPERWPAAKSRGLVDAKTEAFVTKMMAQMSVREKVGQMIQADIGTIKPEDLRAYPLGSVLGGGNSPPLNGDQRAPREEWVRTARAFRAVAIEERAGHVPIPIIFGMDSVHGNANVVGATIFPHNIGLGAANDPDLIRRIGDATAKESAAAGFDWTFGPTVAVPQDDRWGRTYEGYSESPEIVKAYAGQVVLGLQGPPGASRIQDGRAAASIKHFVGDGATRDGIDQGDAQISERELIDVHAQGYVTGIDAGAMTAMTSFSSWNGAKMTANKSLITDVLKGRMGFDGFVVSDWNSHGQVTGCTNEDCPAAFNAGLDMAMVPNDWKALFDNTLKAVETGKIPMARLDDAVRRILRVKAKFGLFDPTRPYEDRGEMLGAAAHRAIAREAVAKSLVLLKNNGGLLPIQPGAKLLVAGSHADDIGLQSGGWTISWQGTGNTNAMFPGGQSIWAGLERAVKEAGGTAELSKDGVFKTKPDVAIVVFGETPYAELVGDIPTLEFQPGDKQALALLKKLKAAGIPVVSLFLSGRPLWVNPEINASDAFVAGWLPGSEGEGVADVLVAGRSGKPQRGFTGKLSFSWPKTAAQYRLDRRQPGYDPLYAYGYGMTYADRREQPLYGEVAGVSAGAANIGNYYLPGREPAPWKFQTSGAVKTSAVDGAGIQEGARRFDFGGEGSVAIKGATLDLTRQANAEMAIRLDYRVDRAPTGPVKAGVGETLVDVSSWFRDAKPGEWKSVRLPLNCIRRAGGDLSSVEAPFVLAARDLSLSISTVVLNADQDGTGCPTGS